MITLFSFVRLPFLLLVFGIELSPTLEIWIMLLWVWIYNFIDDKYSTSKKIENLLESPKITLCFSVITIAFTLFVLYDGYTNQKPRD